MEMSADITVELELDIDEFRSLYSFCEYVFNKDNVDPKEIKIFKKITHNLENFWLEDMA